MKEDSTPRTSTENPAGSPKVSIGNTDFKRFEALLKGVVAVPKEEAQAIEHRRRRGKSS